MSNPCPRCGFPLEDDGHCPVCAEVDKLVARQAVTNPGPASLEESLGGLKGAVLAPREPAVGGTADGAAATVAAPESGGGGAGRRARAQQPPGEPEREGDIAWEDITELAEGDTFVVGLLGFPAAGKTWFLNRLKRVCLDHRGLITMPEPAAQGSKVGRTFAITAHNFVAEGSGFVIMDLPGERFLAAVEAQFAEESRLLHAMDACDAFIVMLPVDEAFFSGLAAKVYGAPEAGAVDLRSAIDAEAHRRQRVMELEAETEHVRMLVAQLRAAAKAAPNDKAKAAAQVSAKARQTEIRQELAQLKKEAAVDEAVRLAGAERLLTKFVDGVGRMTGVLSMRAAELAPPYSDRAVAAHMTSKAFRRCSKPTFVALTKADLLNAPSAVLSRLASAPHEKASLADYAADPLHTARTFRPNMATQFEKWFEWWKFDFVSAFTGDTRSERIDYGCPHRGVVPVIEWIEWVNQSRKWDDRRWADLRLARRIRRMVDRRPPSAWKIDLTKSPRSD